MAGSVDIDFLRLRLENRFGLSLSCAKETVDGGTFPVFRIEGIERGTGFGIVLANTPKQVEASFRADNFAATLLRRMADSDHAAKLTFNALLDDTRCKKAQVFIGINGDTCDVLPENCDAWKRFDLDVNLRFNSASKQDTTILEQAFIVTAGCLGMVLALLMADDLVTTAFEQGLPEGARTLIEVNRYERNPANRAACLNYYGSVCQACNFNYADIYGKLGEGYIEVHHRVPVSEMKGEYCLNPISDLVPLCANCHAMVHRADPILQVEDLRALLERHRKTLRSEDNPSIILQYPSGSF